jgi:HPt (histidine-containing phosphotransfer) domain-containing protein
MFLAEGFDGFVPKPIETVELERVLKHVLPRTCYTYEAEVKESVAYKDLELLNYQSMDEAYSQADEALNSSLEDVKGDDGYKDLRSLGVNTVSGLRYCKNDKDFYNELLMEYARDRENKAGELDRLYNEGIWDDYKIRIHGVKSTSKMIGASALFEKARVLEEASGAGDEETLKKCHPDFMPKYIQLMDLIGSMFDEEDDDPGEEDILEFEPKEQG